MTVFHMKCFVSLVSTKKQAETAGVLGIQPSTISKYIEHMEDEFSVKLFQKTANGLDLTKEGALLYPSIQYMLKKYEDLTTQMGKFSPKWRENIKVSSMFHQANILKLLKEFSKIYPEIKLSISEQSVSNVSRAIESESVDAAIIYKEFLPKKYFYTFSMQEIELVAVVNKEHPLAGEEYISVSDLRDEQFVLFKGDAQMYSFLIHTCISADFVPNEINLDLRTYTIMEYLSSHKGVTLLMQNVVKSYNNDKLVAIRLKEQPKLTMSIIFPCEYPTKTSEKLIEYIGSYTM